MSRAINVQVKSNKRDGLDERDIKRFFKKCKKQEVLKEHLDKVSFHRTKSQKRKDKQRMNEFLRSKFKKKNRR